MSLHLRLPLPPVLIALGIALALTAGLVASGQPALDPTRVPGLPTQPPPRLVPGPQAPDPARAASPRQQIQTVAGWQLISFPVGRLEALRGLDSMLLRRGPSGLEPVDPVNHPEQVDPGLAWLAWCDRPGVIDFAGPDTDSSYRTTPLYAGWNLLARPFNRPVRREAITVTRPGGTTARPSQVASPLTTPGRAWLYSKVFAWKDGQWQAGDLGQVGDLFTDSQLGAVFCWTELELNWNQTLPAGGVPQLDRVSPPRATPGQTVTVSGRALGQAGRGILSLAGLPVQPEDILAWTPTRVDFRVPAGAASGGLQVLVDRYPGNSLPLVVGPAPARTRPLPPSTGSLVGQVVSSDGRLLANAQIHLDDGQQTISDANGAFRLDALPAGTMKAYITLPGFKSASGQVEVAPGATRTLQIALSPTSGQEVGARSQEATGTFTVTAMAFHHGPEPHNRYRVYRIEAWEYGNYHRRWENTWWNDVDDASVDLKCTGAPLGRSYAVVVTWRSQDGDERSCRWTPEIHRDGETLRYYNPLGSHG